MSARDEARRLRGLGYEPFQLPPGKKAPPPEGVTGYDGRALTDEQIGEVEPGANLGIRLPDGVVGIDVDAYAHGLKTIDGLTADLGGLPSTWATHSGRGDGSRISLFRVPVGTELISGLLGVQFIQWFHRYAIVWPSVHPEGRRYGWLDPSGEVTDERPDIADLADLPWSWMDRLRVVRATGSMGSATREEVRDFIGTYTKAERPDMLRGVETMLNRATGKGSRHDTLVRQACLVARESKAGCYSAAAGFELLTQWFDTVMGSDRLDVRGHEVGSAICWAIAQAAATPEVLRKEIEQRNPDPIRVRDSLVTGAADSESSNASGPSDLVVDLPPSLPSEFWTARPWLTHVRDAAWSRSLSPDAVLGAVLARHSALVPTCYGVPPMVGSRATLDVLVVIVGTSSSGKSSANNVSKELVPHTLEKAIRWDMPNPSGEGLIDAVYSETTGENGKRNREFGSVHFIVDEVSTLLAQASRNGSTVTSVMASAWSGATLGNANASKERRRIVEAGSARFAGLVGAQIRPAAGLLSEDLIAMGFTGRLLFVSAHDPSIPDEEPIWPGPLDLSPMPKITHDAADLVYPPSVVREVKAARKAATRGQVAEDTVTGHDRLNRIKIAGLLSLAEERRAVSADDWALAGIAVETSVQIRTLIKRISVNESRSENRRRGVVAAERQDATEEHLDAIHQRKVSETAVRIVDLANRHGVMPRSDMRRRITPNRRRLVDQAIDLAVGEEKLDS